MPKLTGQGHKIAPLELLDELFVPLLLVFLPQAFVLPSLTLLMLIMVCRCCHTGAGESVFDMVDLVRSEGAVSFTAEVRSYRR